MKKGSLLLVVRKQKPPAPCPTPRHWPGSQLDHAVLLMDINHPPHADLTQGHGQLRRAPTQQQTVPPLVPSEGFLLYTHCSLALVLPPAPRALCVRSLSQNCPRFRQHPIQSEPHFLRPSPNLRPKPRPTAASREHPSAPRFPMGRVPPGCSEG